MAGLYKEMSNLKIPVEGLKLCDYSIIVNMVEGHNIYHIHKVNKLGYSKPIISVTKLGAQSCMYREQFFEEVKQIKALIEDYNSYIDYF